MTPERTQSIAFRRSPSTSVPFLPPIATSVIFRPIKHPKQSPAQQKRAAKKKRNKRAYAY